LVEPADAGGAAQPARARDDLRNDYSPDVYTPEGINWVEGSTMVDVLLRHHPELGPALDGVENAFAPWNELG